MPKPILLLLLAAVWAAVCVTGSYAQVATVEAQIRIKHIGDAAKNDNSNVVLWLLPLGIQGQPAESRPAHYKIEQKNKQFHPHVLAVPVGTAVEFPNEDPFFHNVFSLYKGKRFDLGLYEAGSSRKVIFDKPGVSFIFCNIHPDMSAYVLALETPYFGISNKRGQLTMSGVPRGKYRMEVWYERAETADLQALSRMVEIDNSSLSLGTLHLTDSPRFQPKHLNKHGRPYDPEQTPY